MPKLSRDQLTFLGQLGDALVQLRLMGPWVSDRSFEDEGGKIYYAVDADVVKTYGNPWSNALTHDNRLGYGQVFRTDGNEISAATAARLADHIFFFLSPQFPLIFIPPIETEVWSILNAIVRKFGHNPSTIWFEPKKFEETLDEIRAGLNGSLPVELFDQVLRLIYLETESPEAEFRRLSRLVELKRVVSPEVLVDQYTVDDELKKTLEPFNSLGDLIDHATLKVEWFKLLTRDIPSDSRRAAALDRDADALARLEVWNSKLRNSNIRILYVTGARHIHQAAWAKQLPGAQGDFGSSFIRHPRFFLAAPNILRDEAADLSFDSASGFARWLRTLVGRLQIEDSSPGDDLWATELNSKDRALALAGLAQEPEIASELKSKWAEFSKDIRIAYESPRQIKDKIVEDLNRVTGATTALNNWYNLRLDLQTKIQEKTELAWEACFRVATESAFLVVYGGPDRIDHSMGAVPPLRFDSWPKTQAFVRTVSRWHSPQDLNKSLYDEGVKNLKLEITPEARSNYGYYLAHSALFAARGEWQVAAILAERALNYANQPPFNADNHANGREASYLAAFCHRHTVNTPEGLEIGRIHVERAQEIYRDEKIARPELDAVEERFEVEDIAIAVTRLMFKRYSLSAIVEESYSPPPPKLEWLEEAMQLIDHYTLLAKKVNDRKEKWKLNDSSDLEGIQDIATRLWARININICGLLISMNALNENIRPDTLKELALVPLEDRSYFRESVMICVRIVAGISGLSRKQISDHYSQHNIQRYRVFPYDTARFTHMRNYALSLHKRLA